MANNAIKAPNTFLPLLPTTSIAYKPNVVEPAQAETAIEGINIFAAAQKNTRSSSSATDDSSISPRSSVDGAVPADLKNGGFLRLGV
jgi:hypothetical protein